MDFPSLQGNGTEHIPTFLTSLAIGLLIGLERERNPSAKAGLRTFALTALAGTLSAMLSALTHSPWVLGLGLFSIALIIVMAYFGPKAPEEDPGTTTSAALIVCFLLGAMVWYDARTLALMLAIAVSILLYFKPELRGWTRELSRRDIISIFQFGVLTFIVLPILPDISYGPYQTLNPHQTWLMVVLISGLSLAGYLALQFVGQRYGAPLLGFLGGLVSSTATTLVYAKHGRNEAMVQLAAIVILIANLVVIVRLGVEALVVSPKSLPYLLPVLGSGLAFGLVGALFQWRSLARNQDLPLPEISNPTEIRSALGFGLLYAAVLFFSAWLSDQMGSKGLYAVAIISGLTDVDAITLSSLRLFETGKLLPGQAVTAIVLAFLANMTFKFGLIFTIAGARLSRKVAIGFAAMGAGMGLGILFML
ncbi:MAG: MgtC/SapB family protein [Sulfuricellaceae bacterium]|nr:MgtC/SapB family protein [Sulfuricellaceae bacterium]